MPNVQFDVRDLQELKKQFDPKDVEKALKWAVNATARKAATRISKETRQRYTVSAGDIRKRMAIERYRDNIDRAVLYTGRRLPLTQFKPRERWVSVNPKRRVKSGPRKGSMVRRRGVTVQVRKGEGRKLVQGGWLAKNHIFRRKTRSDNQSTPEMRFGPSIPEMVDNQQVMDAAQNLVREDLPQQFNDRLNYILNKKAGLV
ncbi:phage tail protein [Vreelandella venusta]|uniref:phage tail protein n=1 Tax=Vreelandella venusta TaxID=44935 RepID=UPI0018DA6A9B|nr:phage tail protein [Halomonas venusta]QPI65881.1 phage tail protein [Halomonas venusta]